MIMQYTRLVSFIVTLLLSVAVARADSVTTDKHIYFTCSLDASIPAVQTLESYYREAFKRLGYTFEIRQRPARRAIAEAANGISDGECARIKNQLDETYRNHLLTADVIIGRSTINIWGRQPERISLADLANPKLTIGYIDGIESSRRLLEKMTLKYGDKAPNPLAVANYAAALRMLTAGRIDYCIGPQPSLQTAAVQTNLTEQVFDAGTLYTIEASPVLNIKHRKLLEPLSRELRDIIAERGTIVAQ